MPTYSYRCYECEHEFDKRQRMSEDPLTVCPECGGSIRRVVNSVGILFKGSGFYVTDNRSAQSPAASSSKKDGEAKSSATTPDSKEGTGSKKEAGEKKESKSSSKVTA